MKGYVVVQSHPYVAISDKDGNFELKNVPRGVPVEFQAWHEASTAGNSALQAERPDLKWQPNGRFTVTLKPDEVLDLKEIKVAGGVAGGEIARKGRAPRGSICIGNHFSS